MTQALGNIFIVFIGTKLWFNFQKSVSFFETPNDGIIDRMHDNKYVDAINNYLHKNKNVAAYSMILSSLLFDINFIIMAVDFIFYNNYKIYLMTLAIMVLRHFCQLATRLPFPKHMLWFNPGFPTIINTYETSNDFFFSGHTAFSLAWGMTLFGWNSILMKIYALLFIAIEIGFLIITKSHYFMDIYAGATTYFSLAYLFSFF